MSFEQSEIVTKATHPTQSVQWRHECRLDFCNELIWEDHSSDRCRHWQSLIQKLVSRGRKYQCALFEYVVRDLIVDRQCLVSLRGKPEDNPSSSSSSFFLLVYSFGRSISLRFLCNRASPKSYRTENIAHCFESGACLSVCRLSRHTLILHNDSVIPTHKHIFQCRITAYRLFQDVANISALARRNGFNWLQTRNGTKDDRPDDIGDIGSVLQLPMITITCQIALRTLR